MELVYLAPIAGIVALLFAAYLMSSVLKESPGNEKMQEISQAIFEGAMAFLNRQYKTLIPFTVIIFVILFAVSGVQLGYLIPGGRRLFGDCRLCRHDFDH